MAGPRRPQPGGYRRTAAAVNLLLGVFQVLLPCCRPGGAQGQAIEPLPNVVELWQAEEGELLLPTQPFQSEGVDNGNWQKVKQEMGDSEEEVEEQSQEQSFSDKLFSGKGLRFQPSVLDFGIQFLGHPAAKMLYAYNPSQESEVVVNSVFTAAGHFHVPPVHCRVIPAMGKTSFRIIFLPTEEGSIQSSLFINTSSYGVLSYHVSGVGTRQVSREGSAEQLPNAYFPLPQVQSIQLSQTQGTCVPVYVELASYYFLTFLEKPDTYRHKLSILSFLLYTAPQKHVLVCPLHQEQTLSKYRKAETTNTSLLQVQLECSLHNKVCQQLKSCYLESDDVLRLQMSIIVSMENASKEFEENTQDLLDHLSIVYVATEQSETSDDSTVNMYILHSGSRLIWIQDVRHSSSQRDALSVQFEPVLLPASTTNFTKIASFSCKATSCDSGIKDVKKTKSTPSLKACLSSPVVQGYFRMDPSAAQFLMETHENTSGVWSIWYRNRFDRHLVLNHVFVSKDARHVVKILNFTGPLFLPPGCWNIFSLKLAVKDIAINLFTHVFLTTNIGAVFAIPLQIYSAPTKEGSLGFEVIAHCGMHYFMGKSKAGNPGWERSLSLDWSTWGVDSDLANKLYERWKKFKNGDVCKRNVLGMTRFAHLKKSKESEAFVSFLPRLLSEPGLVLNFSATALRNSAVKYFVVKNPSSLLVSLQLLPLSLYPKPEAAVRLVQKWFGVDMQMINFTTGEFQLTKACSSQGGRSEEPGSGVMHLHLRPLEARRVGVVFTPADYGRVSSLILIRNNLTVIDMVGVEGFGARELLKVGGRLPGTGGSLRFKVPESTLMDCRRQLKDSKQILSITKNFKVENIGPLPLTVTFLRINGYNCQGYGFEVLDCHPFSLDPNTSRDISIVFTPDFTSSWVIRELALVTAANLEFRFTLNVTLPHHLLPLCADVVPGPSWEESFWKLTVVFVSLSLLGVILIAFQQAQYILTEFMKTRQRQNAGSSSQQSTSAMDVMSSHSHKSNCKNFLDTYVPSDKGRGKSCLPVNTPQSRVQSATKRSPATYGHSQKKHKCSVYYSKHKSGTPVTSAACAAAEEKQALALGGSLVAAKEDPCAEVSAESWVNFKYPSDIHINLQKNLTLPKNLLNKEENTLKTAIAASTPSSECHVKEGTQTCMFPKETDLKPSESGAELGGELCALKSSKKLPENHSPRNSPQYQSDLPELSRKNNGNNQQVPVKNEGDSCESLRKTDTKSSSEKKIHKAAKEDAWPEKQGVPSVEQEDPYRKKKLQEKKEGHLQNLNWNKNRTCRKNKKRGIAQTLRPSEQSGLKLVCSEFERSEPSSDVSGRSWCMQENAGDACKADAGLGSASPVPQAGAEGCCQKPGKPCAEKARSDSSSDCSSSSGSVRASRGSWGSWSSASSLDGDKRPVAGPQRCPPAGDSSSQNNFPVETPVPLSLPHDVCGPTDVNNLPQYAEPPCPSLPAGPEEDKDLYPPGELWPAQPMCVTSSFNCTLDTSAPSAGQGPAPVHSSSFVDWNTTCEGQFPNMYCPLDVSDYTAFPEENMSYPHGFPCPAEVHTDFAEHAWSPPTSLPTAWGHAGLISSPPYLTSTRSLSPMSGLFGSIWAPQSDVYDSCCPASPGAEHSAHVESQAVMCKEYYPGFNPFRAYMDLDIWTSPASRGAGFPLSRDPSYCGNV